MRSTTLVIAMAAVSSVATAAQQGLQFSALFPDDTLPYANLLVPQNEDPFARPAETANQVPAVASEDAVLTLLTGSFLIVAGHRKLRLLHRPGRKRVRTEVRLMASN